MEQTGPELPSPKPEKRKRDQDEDNTSSSDTEPGPSPPALTTATTTKRARVIGPSLPPPIIESQSTLTSTNPTSADSDTSDSDDDDDDFGPSLPPTDTHTSNPSNAPPPPLTPSTTSHAPPQPTHSKRDDWMLIPPSKNDWSARVDPTKIKSRKFNTGKGGSSSTTTTTTTSSSSAWHETPAEKQARLQREMMGATQQTALSASTAQTTRTNKVVDNETTKRLQEYNKSRGPSLYEAHQKSQMLEQDDDPSSRAFDREKDIGGVGQVNTTQRRDMMKKAAGFGERFGTARYL